MKREIFISVRILLGLFLFFLSPSLYAEETNLPTIERVVDANTAVIKGGQRIRFIGVNAPSIHDTEANSRLQYAEDKTEKELFEIAYQAKRFVEFLVKGQRVRLELEPNFASFQHRDKDGSILVYAWFTSPVFAEPPDWLVVDPDLKTGTQDAFLNAAIVRAGYAQMDKRWPFTYAEKFLALEQEASDQKRGFWAEGAPEEAQDDPA